MQRRFAKRLKRLRARAGLTQEALARKARLSLPYVGRLELGEHDPSLSTLVKLAKALGVRVSSMLGEEPMPREWWRPEREKDEPPRPLRRAALDDPDSYLSREEAEYAAQRLGYPVVARYRNKIGGVIRTPFRARHN